jgi:two-component system response regulator MprA
MATSSSALMTRPKVLVVEDDPATREFLGTALRLGGFDVDTAGDGIAALKQIEEERPDAVLLDLDLPRLNGFAVHAMLQPDDRRTAR